MSMTVVLKLFATLICVFWEGGKTHKAGIEKTYNKFQTKRGTWIKRGQPWNEKMGKGRPSPTWHKDVFCRSLFYCRVSHWSTVKELLWWKTAAGENIQLIRNLNGPPEQSLSHVLSLTEQTVKCLLICYLFSSIFYFYHLISDLKNHRTDHVRWAKDLLLAMQTSW